ncbi:hypothetical protein HanRHA438_Chr00c19g0851851 [Helianthus annuus]|nr:hypothetical protein HanRHA438_Chr00c19g0851851 [Helianthus annuus]
MKNRRSKARTAGRFCFSAGRFRFSGGRFCYPAVFAFHRRFSEDDALKMSGERRRSQ